MQNSYVNAHIVNLIMNGGVDSLKVIPIDQLKSFQVSFRSIRNNDFASYCREFITNETELNFADFIIMLNIAKFINMSKFDEFKKLASEHDIKPTIDFNLIILGNNKEFLVDCIDSSYIGRQK